MIEAKWWRETGDGRIKCTLCPRYCKLKVNQHGFCFIRKNQAGKLVSLGYGRPSGFAIDPIEKKPLNHFLPGTEILSFGTVGCNLGCKFCQNWSISKSKSELRLGDFITPEKVVELAKSHNVPSIAFTYNDPTIFGEYVIDISKTAREEGIKSVMVTAGYITNEAFTDIYKYIDAANVDLKSFSSAFYKKLCLAGLEPVLNTLKRIKNETDVWLELTTLLIPDENDSPDEIKSMSNWILENLGDSVPVHFTAFYPTWKLTNKERTPHSTLTMARNTALSEGLKYCYVGNVYDTEGQTTFCDNCGEKLIVRNWHSVMKVNLKGNRCKKCNKKVEGIFNN